VYTIGAPYLDDSIDNKNSPLYFGITIAVRGIGPVLGISLSSACVRLYVDLNSNPNFKSTDPRWVGAWWLGFLLLAVLLALYALVLAAFPRRLIPPNSKKDAAQVEAPPSATSTSAVKPKEDPGQSNFRNSLMRIIRNPLIICGCGSSIFSILGVVGYVIYLPKYFEHEFRVSKSKAGLFSGLSGSASMIFGVLLSGYVIGRCRPSARSVAAFVAVTKFVYAFGLLFIMLFNCGLENDLPGVLTANGSLTLGGSCSQDCYCNTEKFSPVCSRGSDGVNQTYFSPCHAGCSVETSVDNGTVYSDCRCGSDIETGFCQKTCSNMYIYMILLSIIKFIVSLSTVGNLIINLRCVNDGDKALALGILATAVALFGFLPNPIIYGAVIDSSCLVWEQSCGKRGSCWVYATDQFRYRLHGVTSGFLLIAGVFEVITYFQIKDLKLFDSRK